MKHILKVGDMLYAQSIQQTTKSYLTHFPQREQYLLQFAKNITFTCFKHSSLNSIGDAIKQQKAFKKFLSEIKTPIDGILIDNPLSILVIPETVTTPIIFDAIDWYDEMYLKEFGVNAKYYLLRYALLTALSRADKAIVQSPVLLQSLKNWGLKTKHTCVIPNGYDKKIFYPYSLEQKNTARKVISRKHKLNFSGKKIIVYTGKISRWYQDLVLIAQAITPDQIFLIVGDGPIIDQLPTAPNIITCGPVDIAEVPHYTNIADAVVFPVYADCSPIAISEYLAVGKPIVMAEGKMNWLLTDGTTGSLVQNTQSSWQKGITRAIQNQKIIKKNNLNLAKKLSWQVLAKKFVEFIEK